MTRKSTGRLERDRALAQRMIPADKAELDKARAVERAVAAERERLLKIVDEVETMNYWQDHAGLICQHAYDIATLMQRTEVSPALAQRGLYRALWDVQGQILAIYESTPAWDDERRAQSNRVFSCWLSAILDGEKGDDGDALRELGTDPVMGVDPETRLIGLVRAVRKSDRKKVSAEAARTIELIEQLHIKGQEWDATAYRIIRYLHDQQRREPDEEDIIKTLETHSTPGKHLKRVWDREMERRRNNP